MEAQNFLLHLPERQFYFPCLKAGITTPLRGLLLFCRLQEACLAQHIEVQFSPL
jgi:hypothetical protein